MTRPVKVPWQDGPGSRWAVRHGAVEVGRPRSRLRWAAGRSRAKQDSVLTPLARNLAGAAVWRRVVAETPSDDRFGCRFTGLRGTGNGNDPGRARPVTTGDSAGYGPLACGDRRGLGTATRPCAARRRRSRWGLFLLCLWHAAWSRIRAVRAVLSSTRLKRPRSCASTPATCAAPLGRYAPSTGSRRRSGRSLTSRAAPMARDPLMQEAP